MFIELSDFLIHLNRLGLLMVCVAVWMVVPQLLPDDKKEQWRMLTDTVLGKSLDFFFSMLFVCGVFFYTVLLFFLSANLLQSLTNYVGIPSTLNFMVIILALPLTAIIQTYSMRQLMKIGVPSSAKEHDTGIQSVRLGTLLLSTGFLFQFLATFG
jgi:uncharacterized membrane protein